MDCRLLQLHVGRPLGNGSAYLVESPVPNAVLEHPRYTRFEELGRGGGEEGLEVGGGEVGEGGEGEFAQVGDCLLYTSRCV